MKKYIIISLLCLFAIGCSNSAHFHLPGMYKVNIQQGNLITDSMLEKLRPGLSRKQVLYVMGTPMASDIFNKNRWDYVYQNRGTEGKIEHRVLSIYFINERLTRLETR